MARLDTRKRAEWQERLDRFQASGLMENMWPSSTSTAICGGAVSTAKRQPSGTIPTCIPRVPKQNSGVVMFRDSGVQVAGAELHSNGRE